MGRGRLPCWRDTRHPPSPVDDGFSTILFPRRASTNFLGRSRILLTSLVVLRSNLYTRELEGNLSYVSGLETNATV
jgi:hypothetical protein